MSEVGMVTHLSQDHGIELIVDAKGKAVPGAPAPAPLQRFTATRAFAKRQNRFLMNNSMAMRKGKAQLAELLAAAKGKSAAKGNDDSVDELDSISSHEADETLDPGSDSESDSDSSGYMPRVGVPAKAAGRAPASSSSSRQCAR